jgi:hypothetical protein
MKRTIPPRPKERIGSLFWMLTYHTGKMLALVALIAAAAYLILCFSCQVETPWGSIGSKPVETKVNINK